MNTTNVNLSMDVRWIVGLLTVGLLHLFCSAPVAHGKWVHDFSGTRCYSGPYCPTCPSVYLYTIPVHMPTSEDRANHLQYFGHNDVAEGKDGREIVWIRRYYA